MRPMLAVTGDVTVLDKPGYIYEPKLDGFRALLYIGKNVRFISRNGKDFTKRFFPNIHRPPIKAVSAIIDGEIVAYDRAGNPDFNLLSNGGRAVFVAFDILKKDGQDLRMKPLMERKKILRSTLSGNSMIQRIVCTEHGRKLWNIMKQHNLEGVIAKKKNSVYKDGDRSESWLKIKLSNSIDTIVVGFTHSKREISSLALGLCDDGIITYIGKVGTGFDETFMKQFLSKLTRIRITTRIPLLPKDIIPVKPQYVVEVEYREFTPDNKLRSSIFKRLREDKTISECHFPTLRK